MGFCATVVFPGHAHLLLAQTHVSIILIIGDGTNMETCPYMYILLKRSRGALFTHNLPLFYNRNTMLTIDYV